MFKLLRTFKAVYETKNFSKAAEVLFVSQPAVSTQIKQLEEELDVTLFYRNGRQDIQATEQAQILYERLLNLEDDWKETNRLLTSVKKEEEYCKITASNTFAVYYLPKLMKKLIHQFPNIIFEVSMENSEQVVEKINKHHAHFGFIEKPLITGEIKRKQLLLDELVLAGNPTQQFWLVREKTSGVYHYTKQYFLEKNLTPNLLVVENNEIIVKLLEQQVGCSLISKKAVTKKIKWQSLEQNYQRPFYFLAKQNIQSHQLQQVEKVIQQFDFD